LRDVSRPARHGVRAAPAADLRDQRPRPSHQDA
jgi:hypothetical protein